MLESFDNPPKILYKNRYCNQDNFRVLVCRGKNKTGKFVKIAIKLHGSKLKCKEPVCMPEALYDCKTAVISINASLKAKKKLRLHRFLFEKWKIKKN